MKLLQKLKLREKNPVFQDHNYFKRKRTNSIHSMIFDFISLLFLLWGYSLPFDCICVIVAMLFVFLTFDIVSVVYYHIKTIRSVNDEKE